VISGEQVAPEVGEARNASGTNYSNGLHCALC